MNRHPYKETVAYIDPMYGPNEPPLELQDVPVLNTDSVYLYTRRAMVFLAALVVLIVLPAIAGYFVNR